MRFELVYIDPGSGGLLIQIIIAGATSILIFFRSAKLFFLNIFKRIFKKPPQK